MSDPLASAKAVLRRANKHIIDLELAVEAFKAGQPYTFAIEFDPDFGKHLLKAKFDTAVFEDMSCIIFDAVNNMRSCLDQMTYAVSHKHTGSEKWAAYPFSTAAEFPNAINSLDKNKRVPAEILTLFEWQQPYKGGNSTLWAMNYMANVKKHARLVPTGVGSGASLTFPTGQTPIGEFVATPAHLNRSDEIIILAVQPDASIPKMDLRTFVVIDDTEEVIQGQQPVGLLIRMRDHVATVLRDTEAVCRGIGLF